MSSRPKQAKIEVRTSVPGLKEAIVAELRHRAKWKGKRGKPYRMLLLSMATEKETIQ